MDAKEWFYIVVVVVIVIWERMNSDPNAENLKAS
jgi:hypothetical protein